MSFGCAYDDGEEAQISWEETFTARKVHKRCAQCREPIEPGDRYVRVTWIYDGEYGHAKNHEECLEAARFLWRLDYDWDGPRGFEEAYAHAWGGQKAVDAMRARKQKGGAVMEPKDTDDRVIKITPEDAKRILGKYTEPNRKFDKACVDAIVEQMRRFAFVKDEAKPRKCPSQEA